MSDSTDAAARLAAEIVETRSKLERLEAQYAEIAPRAELTTKPRTVRQYVEMYGPQSWRGLLTATGLSVSDLAQQCQLHQLHKWPDDRYHLEPFGT